MRRVMSNINWMVLALLAVTMTAAAQQPASAPQNPQPVARAAARPRLRQRQAQTNLAPPTTMDQVVDRVIMREKDLIKFLSPRTPIVETYLQNLTQDPQLGPIPQDDHYFLGRMDLSDSIDRSDYLQERQRQRQRRRHGEASSGRTHEEVQVPVSAAGLFVDDLRRPQRL